MESPKGVAPAHDRSRAKVLVADDERMIADTLAIILSHAGFETATAYDGTEAVEKAWAWKPDLLLSDVVMPGLNGIDAAIQIRRMIPDCRVLLFSGQAGTAGMLDDARVRGHKFEILQKPVHPYELLDRLRKLCDLK
jgi:CheY-like chemotaxis protein